MNCSRFGVVVLASVVCLSLSVADASAQRRGGGGGGGRPGGGGGGGGARQGGGARPVGPGPSGGAAVGRAVPRGTVVAAPRGGYYRGGYRGGYYGGRYPYYGYGRPYYYPRSYYGYGLPYYRYPGFSFGFSVGIGYPYYGYGYYGYPYYGYPYGYSYPYSYPYYYPSYGYSAPTGYVSAGAPAYGVGGVRIQNAPREAQVFVDGTYAGIVDDFDGTFQSLDLQAGPHQVEIRAPGRQPIHYDVNVQPGQTLQIHVR